MFASEMRFCTKPKDGQLTVLARDNRFELHLPDPLPSPAVFTTPSALMVAITGRHGTSFARYFKIDDLKSKLPEIPRPSSALIVQPRPLIQPRQQALTIAIPTGLGIDLQLRGHEVRKILFAGFGSWMSRYGYDPEDVLQDVYRGILARNEGRCPFDASKSSFGHYVHMVANCVVSNYHRREQRRRENEQVGIRPAKSRDLDDQFGGFSDAALEATQRPSNLDLAPDRDLDLERILARLPDRQTRQVAILLGEGLCRREIAGRLSVPLRDVERAVKTAREALSDCR